MTIHRNIKEWRGRNLQCNWKDFRKFIDTYPILCTICQWHISYTILPWFYLIFGNLEEWYFVPFYRVSKHPRWAFANCRLDGSSIESHQMALGILLDSWGANLRISRSKEYGAQTLVSHCHTNMLPYPKYNDIVCCSTIWVGKWILNVDRFDWIWIGSTIWWCAHVFHHTKFV